jgi:diguanylate cyclase (GGDEF)-like protein
VPAKPLRGIFSGFPGPAMRHHPRMNAHRPSLLMVDAQADALSARLESAGLTVSFAPDAGAARQHDAVLLRAANRAALAALGRRADLPQMAYDSAVVVLCPLADDKIEAELLRLGVEAVVGDTLSLPRAVVHAVHRKRAERVARTAYATDLGTGLPHQAQLLEHMTQLVALRERVPAPMVLLVLRIEGLAGTTAQLGPEAGNILRRKVAVRLRSGLRAADVVAAIGPDAFGVLLGHLEQPTDGERVAAKLVHALRQPFQVAGQPCAVATAVGLALYPEHGKDAEALLQRASAQAGSVVAMGGEGYAAMGQRGASGAAAANDES